jgi:hypothetical protein
LAFRDLITKIWLPFGIKRYYSILWCNPSRRNCLMIHDVVSAGPTLSHVATRSRKRIDWHLYSL